MKSEQVLASLGLLLTVAFGLVAGAPRIRNAVGNSTKFRSRFAEDFPWETFCTDFNVPDATFFPHPEDCQYYLICFEGDLLADLCDDGLHFNPQTDDCVPAGSFECVLGLLPRWPPHHDDCPPPGSNELVLLPSLYCDAFYICVNGEPVEMQCRPGQHWNADRLYCDHPSRAGCDGENGNGPLLPDCPIGFTGSLPHPDDCNLFIHCNNGNRNIQRCQHLHHFDVISARCMIMTQAECIDEFRGRRN